MGELLEPADETGDDRVTPGYLLTDGPDAEAGSSSEKVKGSIPRPEWGMRSRAVGRRS